MRAGNESGEREGKREIYNAGRWRSVRRAGRAARAARSCGAARAWHGARPRALSLRIGKSAGKQEAGVHHRSVRCDARECTENVRLGAVAHGRLVCNKCLPPCRYIRAQRQDGARGASF